MKMNKTLRAMPLFVEWHHPLIKSFNKKWSDEIKEGGTPEEYLDDIAVLQRITTLMLDFAKRMNKKAVNGNGLNAEQSAESINSGGVERHAEVL